MDILSFVVLSSKVGVPPEDSCDELIAVTSDVSIIGTDSETDTLASEGADSPEAQEPADIARITVRVKQKSLFMNYLNPINKYIYIYIYIS